MGESTEFCPSSWYWMTVRAGSGHWCHHSSPLPVHARVLLRAVGEVDPAEGSVVADVLEGGHDGVAVGRAGLADGLRDDRDRVVGLHRVALDGRLPGPLLVDRREVLRLVVEQVLGHPDPLHERVVAVRHVLPVGLALQGDLPGVEGKVLRADAGVRRLLGRSCSPPRRSRG